MYAIWSIETIEYFKHMNCPCYMFTCLKVIQVPHPQFPMYVLSAIKGSRDGHHWNITTVSVIWTQDWTILMQFLLNIVGSTPQLLTSSFDEVDCNAELSPLPRNQVHDFCSLTAQRSQTNHAALLSSSSIWKLERSYLRRRLDTGSWSFEEWRRDLQVNFDTAIGSKLSLNVMKQTPD
jgi:hypothetical protein